MSDECTINEMMQRRGVRHPDLGFLDLGEPTTYGTDFAYSPEMIAAIGSKANSSVPKGCFNHGKYGPTAAPWEPVPKEMEAPVESLYQKDFMGRKQLEPVSGSLLDAKEMRKKFSTDSKVRREQQEREARERKEKENKAREAVVDQELLRAKDKSGSRKVFDHQGVSVRSYSAPLEKFEHDIKMLSEREAYRRRLVPVSLPCAPVIQQNRAASSMMMNATDAPSSSSSTTTSPPPPSSSSANANTTASTTTELNRKEATFWYPADRQRVKHRLLEEMRFTNSQANLLRSGWATHTVPEGRPKREGTKPEEDMKLDEKQKKKVEEDMKKFFQEKEERDKARKNKYKEMLEHARPNEKAGVVPVTTTPFATEDPGAFDQDKTHREERKSLVVGSAQFERPLPFKPLSVYRPELPAAIKPEGAAAKIERLEIPPEARVEAPPMAPPWGRQTSLDDKWQKVRVFNTRSKAKKFEPIQKLEIDRELRTVRDGGLLKKERQSIIKTMDPKQVSYIKSLPPDFFKMQKQQQGGHQKQPTSMKPVQLPPGASMLVPPGGGGGKK